MKNFIYSKTVWLSVVQGAIGVLTAVTTVSPELNGAGQIMIALAILQFFNRFLTDSKVTVF